MSQFTLDFDESTTAEGEQGFSTLTKPTEPTATTATTVMDGPADSPLPHKPKTLPTCVVVIGMAGAGKTTLMHRINLDMLALEKRGYYINLDPAVRDVPFGANIDIRDTVNYKEVMHQYGLGPNGGILTSLNLFATRFDQVIELLERRAGDLDYIFIDTPGQIETFTWSAGGQIILDLLATSFPTVVMYITDTPRCVSPTTFMSNMLYASSVLYKSQLPMLCVFNKTDVQPFDFAKSWMADFEAYQDAVDSAQQDDYMGSLNRSLSLAMDEFYS
jgi:GPN-loop GTPase